MDPDRIIWQKTIVVAHRDAVSPAAGSGMLRLPPAFARVLRRKSNVGPAPAG